MAIEMICGQCSGNLLVEQFGVVVACPHCGAHLQVPDPDEATSPSPQPEPVSEVETVTPGAQLSEPSQPLSSSAAPDSEPELELEQAPPTEEMRAYSGDEAEPPPSVEISIDPQIAMGTEPEASSATESVAEEQPESVEGAGQFSISTLVAASAPDTLAATTEASSRTDSVVLRVTPAPVTASATVVNEPVADQTPDAVSSGLSGLFGSSVSATAADESAAVITQSSNAAADGSVSDATTEHPPHSAEHSEDSLFPDAAQSVVPAAKSVKPATKDQVLVSKAILMVLISYASAMTLGFGWLLYLMRMGVGGGLESLPDPVPSKKVGFEWYPPRIPMTAGHTLGIGDTQRFGNIKVTVLKVTRGPIEFQHFTYKNQDRTPTFPVLKLWLRFENVSEDQEIAPLDDELLFRRQGTNYTEYKSSQFVCRADQKTKAKPKFVIAYDHTIGSGWDLVGLPIDKPLSPHESREYYVPTCEQGLDELTGDLVWRVHIRKGYSRKGNGVTTLFEVHFDSDDIHNEAA